MINMNGTTAILLCMERSFLNERIRLSDELQNRCDSRGRHVTSTRGTQLSRLASRLRKWLCKYKLAAMWNDWGGIESQVKQSNVLSTEQQLATCRPESLCVAQGVQSIWLSGAIPGSPQGDASLLLRNVILLRGAWSQQVRLLLPNAEASMAERSVSSSLTIYGHLPPLGGLAPTAGSD
jgi:hypothetical protein